MCIWKYPVTYPAQVMCFPVAFWDLVLKHTGTESIMQQPMVNFEIMCRKTMH